MGDGARRDRDIGEHKEIGEPQAAADRGGVLDRFLDLLKIVGLGGDGGQILRRRRGSVQQLGPSRCLRLTAMRAILALSSCPLVTA
jgi:hypothetical protein